MHSFIRRVLHDKIAIDRPAGLWIGSDSCPFPSSTPRNGRRIGSRYYCSSFQWRHNARCTTSEWLVRSSMRFKRGTLIRSECKARKFPGASACDETPASRSTLHVGRVVLVLLFSSALGEQRARSHQPLLSGRLRRVEHLGAASSTANNRPAVTVLVLALLIGWVPLRRGRTPGAYSLIAAGIITCFSLTAVRPRAHHLGSNPAPLTVLMPSRFRQAADRSCMRLR